MSFGLYRFFCPTRYSFLRRAFPGGKFTMLDVGCGHLSFEIIRHYFPEAKYHGVDKRIQGVTEQYEKMDRFFELDLETSRFDEIEDGSYDAIVFSHTIEHLRNGHEVLRQLVRKLRVGGYIYLEFPSERSLYLPSADGTLNFFDDPTHIRFYSIPELANTLLDCNVRVLKAGTARSLARLFLVTPFSLLYNLYYFPRHGRLSTRGLFDVSGFASFLLGVRHQYPHHTRLGSWDLMTEKGDGG
jgi:SAM-dependent methyltransferase